MAHSHSHSSVQAPDNSNARRLLWAFIVTAGFMLIEAVGGAISGSLALLADAGHMLTDSAALLFALLAVRLPRPPPNARHTFGWLRLTTLAAFLQTISLMVINIRNVVEAVSRFHPPQLVTLVKMIVFSTAAR
ncbi:cation diffusion facilitator family transporter, partial [Klebsiella pneumoniae]|uniref:cation diffusion facilitator family transporter n=1 Tax=Klebsiella pneumoniae TaxID=573 RepID=UPI00114F08F4